MSEVVPPAEGERWLLAAAAGDLPHHPGQEELDDQVHHGDGQGERVALHRRTGVGSRWWVSVPFNKLEELEMHAFPALCYSIIEMQKTVCAYV